MYLTDSNSKRIGTYRYCFAKTQTPNYGTGCTAEAWAAGSAVARTPAYDAVLAAGRLVAVLAGALAADC